MKMLVGLILIAIVGSFFIWKVAPESEVGKKIGMIAGYIAALFASLLAGMNWE